MRSRLSSSVGRRWLAVTTTAAIGAIAVISWPADASAALGEPTVFSDPSGDTAGSPDVTDVGVTHTATGGLTITVRIDNEPTLLDGHVVELRFDTDMDPSTGASNGVDRLVHRLWTGRTTLCTWNGGSFSCPPSLAVGSTYVDGLLTVTTTADALGIGDGFDLSVAGYGGSPTDVAPNTGAWRYLLESPDRVAPVLALPDGIDVDATSPQGAQVAFAVSATDDRDPAPVVECSRSSGETFPIGASIVVCSATDAARNTGTGSFSVHVRGPSEQLEVLAGAVGGVGPGTSLADKVDLAATALARGDRGEACDIIDALGRQVTAQIGKSISVGQGAELLSKSNRIRATLGCR